MKSNSNITACLFGREGACLGLGLAVSSMCKESLVDSRVHVTNLYHKLIDILNEQCSGDPDKKLQVDLRPFLTLKQIMKQLF